MSHSENLTGDHMSAEVSSEPSVAWNQGCKAYYMGVECFQNPYQDIKGSLQQYKDWEDGWQYAYESCSNE